MTTREEFITGLRQLADFLTVNPDVAVPPYSTQIQISTNGTDDEVCRQVDAFALASGAEPKWNTSGVHYKAQLEFGPIEYYMVAITEAHMEEYRETQRLGEEALAAKKAAAADVIDVEAVEALELPVASDDVLLMGGAR